MSPVQELDLLLPKGKSSLPRPFKSYLYYFSPCIILSQVCLSPPSQGHNQAGTFPNVLVNITTPARIAFPFYVFCLSNPVLVPSVLGGPPSTLQALNEPFICGCFISQLLGGGKIPILFWKIPDPSPLLLQTRAGCIVGSLENRSWLNVFLVGEPAAADHVPPLPEG